MHYTFNSGGGTHALILRLVSPGSRVLDVGCASGYLGQQLSKRHCTVDGIEVNREAAAVARGSGAYRAVYDIDLDDAAGNMPNEQFDVVLCADVLEHLRDPQRTLFRLRSLVASTGFLLVSLPNVAHFTTRGRLLVGRFEYSTRGILDRTHLHLYTYASARDLLQTAGFDVQCELAGSDRFGNLLSFGPPPFRWLRGLLAYNIVLVCQPTLTTE